MYPLHAIISQQYCRSNYFEMVKKIFCFHLFKNEKVLHRVIGLARVDSVRSSTKNVLFSMLSQSGL